MTRRRLRLRSPASCSNKYRSGWQRGDAFAAAGGDLHAGGPSRVDSETWTGFIDALAAHRDAVANARMDGAA